MAFTAAGDWRSTWTALILADGTWTAASSVVSHWHQGCDVALFPGVANEMPSWRRAGNVVSRLAQELRLRLVSSAHDLDAARLSVFIASSHLEPGLVSLFAEYGEAAATSEVLDTVLTDTLTQSVRAVFPEALTVQTICAACASSVVAIDIARRQLALGFCDTAVVMSVDVLSRAALAGFSRAGALSRSRSRPFDTNRDGIAIGEGAAAVVLRRNECSSIPDPLFVINGSSVSCAAQRLVEPDVRAVSSVVQTALDEAGVAPADVAAVYWHGTGTRVNDEIEANAAKQVFGENIPMSTSLKGTIGHCMGASGILSVIAAFESLATNVLPPVAKSIDAAYSWFPVAAGKAARIASGPILVVSLGFGGVNSCAVVSCAP